MRSSKGFGMFRLTLWGDSIPQAYHFASHTERGLFFDEQLAAGDWKKCHTATFENHSGERFETIAHIENLSEYRKQFEVRP